MKKLIIISLTAALLCSTVKADIKNNAIEKRQQLDELESFSKYLMQSIQYPIAAQLGNHQGNSIITFTIVKGSLKYVNVQTELGKGCDVAVLNSIMAYPRIKNIGDGLYALKTSFRLQGANLGIINEAAKMPIGFTALNTITIMAQATRGVHNKANNSNPIKIVSYGSANIGTDPLYVIDGKVIEAKLQELDPKVIESITILKDASATSLYGLRGANGVIIIKTKVDSIKVKGDTSKVILRGSNSGKDPLYVLDGKVVGIQLNELTPSDIESLEILKDASAIALYGPEAANGVIVIKTKKSETKTETPTTKGNPEVEVSGYGTKMVLRGDNTYGKNPVFVLDGKIMENGNLNDVDPNKIQSIKVLKDASAIALYGPEAYNGAVIITTKKDPIQKTKK